ncbi:magnesium/cobalt transporter CorA [Rubellicoccus peritrichatus]|uniref:Magnesium transport protein CorA n=1 Tax=Rubellicoccus peritrichatus TaxID=3080537 RepID=A0AAQ3LGJ5_9BACT|nr:magnesium/cobalt transporter CorA [Puniceicoccus sp. CR14]WOO41719.1 magnesium/cobalt transporter CorA [Puniceicoccus sp. CR14]
MKVVTREKLYHRGKGLPPGELVKISDGHQGECDIRVISYGVDSIVRKDKCSPEEALDEVGKRAMTWIHITGIHDGAKIKTICERLGMHGLAIEDVLSADARPKFEEFGDNLFLVSRAAMLSDDHKSIFVEQISYFVGNGFLLSVQEGDEPLFATVEKRLQNSPSKLRKSGAAYLLFSLSDVKNDFLMNILDALEADIVEIEEAMLEESEDVTIETIYRKKRAILMMLRIVLPMRDNANRLDLLDHPIISDGDHYYFRDLADYARRAAERVEHSRLVMQNMQEFYHAEQEHKINRVMKVLTIIATLFLPLTFIAGVYGMNFNHEVSWWNMPELYWHYGYPACLLFMAVIFFSFLIWFRKQKWI